MSKTNSLQQAINALAVDFADAILAAIRGASFADLTGGLGLSFEAPSGREVAPGRASRPGKKATPGRLPRRSEDEIQQTVARIAALLQKHPEGLRAEQIRDSLEMAAKELPRPLALGLKTKRLKKKGQKRATTYFAR